MKAGQFDFPVIIQIHTDAFSGICRKEQLPAVGADHAQGPEPWLPLRRCGEKEKAALPDKCHTGIRRNRYIVLQVFADHFVEKIVDAAGKQPAEPD